MRMIIMLNFMKPLIGRVAIGVKGRVMRHDPAIFILILVSLYYYADGVVVRVTPANNIKANILVLELLVLLTSNKRQNHHHN